MTPDWRRWVGWGAGLALFAVIALLKLRMFGTHPHLGWDGALYVDVAQNLRAGRGLTIDVSLFHAGYRFFPHPTALYPLWPAVLSGALSVMPLQAAASVLPTALFFGFLVLAFFWGRQVLPAGTLPLGLHGGHAIVAIMGLHVDLMRVCGIPNTEAMAFFLVFAVLLRAPRMFSALRARDGAELALWCAALVLTRSQLVNAFLAGVVVLPVLLLVRFDRKQVVVFGATFLATFTAAVAPMAWWMGTFMERPTVAAYLDIVLARTPSALRVVDLSAPWPGVGGYLRLVARGLKVAFTSEEEGYGPGGFGRFIWFAPAGVAAALGWLAWRRMRAFGALWHFLRQPTSHGVVWAAVFASSGFAMLHVAGLSHDTWHFNNRHAAPAGLFFFVGFVLLAKCARPLAWMAALALVVGTVQLARKDHTMVQALTPQRPFSERNLALVKWLEQARDAEGGKLTVAMSSQTGREMCWRVPGLGIHTVGAWTRTNDVRTMFHDLGARYLVMQLKDSRRFLKDRTFLRTFQQVAHVKVSRSRSFDIYQLAPQTTAPPTSGTTD